MAKKKAGGAPPQAKRIATSGLSKIALPDMPSMPTATTVVPGMAAGMGGAGFGQGMGMGNGMGSGTGGNGGNGTFSFFGFRGNGNGAGFPGTLYDLKQTKGHAETPVGKDVKLYPEVLKKFSKEGWHESVLSTYLQGAATPLVATQFMVPDMDAQEGPKAYGAEKDVKPSRWCALYKGKVSPPKTMSFRFVGAADDLLMVKFNGHQVLDGSWIPMSDQQPEGVTRMGLADHPRGFCKRQEDRSQRGRVVRHGGHHRRASGRLFLDLPLHGGGGREVQRRRARQSAAAALPRGRYEDPSEHAEAAALRSRKARSGRFRPPAPARCSTR